MPVPMVRTRTTPWLFLPAPKAISARPAASASLMTMTLSSFLPNSLLALTPIHDLSTFAAVRMTPSTTTPGNVMPTGPVHSKWSTSLATTSAIAFGVAGCGVGIRWRSAVSSPVFVSTGAPLIPEPPMSMPRTFILGALPGGITLIPPYQRL